MNHKLISKTIFFPEKGILAFGDLHIGYEHMLKEKGFTFPFSQLENSKKELKPILEKLPVKKIVILGDLKHYFPFKKEEKFEIRNFLKFLTKYMPEENIILIRGNHEKIKLDKQEYQDFYIEGNIAFIHGDKTFPEILDKKIKTIVMGHVHPAIFLEDKTGIKKEKFKCFLLGKWKGKEVIVVPSFFSFTEGTDIRREDYSDKKEFSIIPNKTLQKFNVYIIGKDKVYNFGKVI